VEKMPTEITDVDKFVEMSGNAKFCAVKRLKTQVKLKLRTPSQMYTLKIEPVNAEETIKKLKCEIQEV
jgi:ferritin-like protein